MMGRYFICLESQGFFFFFFETNSEIFSFCDSVVGDSL